MSAARQAGNGCAGCLVGFVGFFVVVFVIGLFASVFA